MAGGATVKLSYTVFSADLVKVTQQVTNADGDTLDAIVDGLSVQLVSATQPTISLTLTGKAAGAWRGAVGDVVEVTFGGAN